MPGTQPTLGKDGNIPPAFSAIAQSMQAQGALAQAAAVQTSQWTLDQYQNSPIIIGPLNQVVTIGAGWISSSPVVGVEVGTNLTGFGLGYISAFACGRLTIASIGTAATLTSTITGSFTNGMVIGATVYETPPVTDSTAPPNYIQPGTTFTISGSSITLSQNALLTGTGLYVCAATFTKLNIDAHP